MNLAKNYYQPGASAPGDKPYRSRRTRNSYGGAMVRSGKRTADLEDLYALTQGEPWMRDAACARADNPDAWFPEPGGDLGEKKAALRICKKCPVSTQCLASALTPPLEVGIWGGLTQRQRREQFPQEGQP